MFRRRRAMSEAECYARCYGDRGMVRVLRASGRPVPLTRLSGEEIRRLFEQRLDSRLREAA